MTAASLCSSRSAVGTDGLPLRRMKVVDDRQLLVHDGTAMRVARVEEEVRTGMRCRR